MPRNRRGPQVVEQKGTFLPPPSPSNFWWHPLQLRKTFQGSLIPTPLLLMRMRQRRRRAEQTPRQRIRGRKRVRINPILKKQKRKTLRKVQPRTMRHYPAQIILLSSLSIIFLASIDPQSSKLPETGISIDNRLGSSTRSSTKTPSTWNSTNWILELPWTSVGPQRYRLFSCSGNSLLSSSSFSCSLIYLLFQGVGVLVFSQNRIKQIRTGTCLFSLAVPLHGQTEELKIISVNTSPPPKRNNPLLTHKDFHGECDRSPWNWWERDGNIEETPTGRGSYCLFGFLFIARWIGNTLQKTPDCPQNGFHAQQVSFSPNLNLVSP